MILDGLRAVVDVQHLYRTGSHAGDRGSVYTLANGTRVTEADATLVYAHAIVSYLELWGARVVSNDPAHGILVGPYSARNLAAQTSHAYLACHLNAGGGAYAAVEYMSTTVGAALAAAIGPQVQAAFPTDIPNAKAIPLSSGQRGAVCIERVASNVAAVICEPFFGDNPRQQHLLDAPSLVRVGEVIAHGVADWWKTRQIAIV